MTSNPIVVDEHPMVTCEGDGNGPCESVNGDVHANCDGTGERPLQVGDPYTGQCPDCLDDDGEGVYEYDDKFPACEFPECPTCEGSGQVTTDATRIQPRINLETSNTEYEIHGEWKPA